MTPKDLGPTSVGALRRLIAILRGEDGCPWDRKQTPATLSVYLIEEMYELVDAMAAGDTAAILEELGDVLFQVLFVAYLYEQEDRFTLEQVLERIIAKMVRRHPHVFGSQKLDSAGEVKQQWQRIKQEEKGQRRALLESVPAGMPALMRAYRISERAAGTGFDWNDLAEVMEQAEQEWAEFKSEVGDGAAAAMDRSKATMELGDVMFTLVNVARLAGIHPETALSRSTRKFIRRFNWMEAEAMAGEQPLESLSRDALDRLWASAKKKDPPGDG
jgi:tetrapyrrole methylase family protein / MazG family protein